MIARNDSALGLFNGDIGMRWIAGRGRASGLRCRTAILVCATESPARARNDVGDDGT